MICSTPKNWHRIRRILMAVGAVALWLASTPGIARAQQSAAHAATAPRHPAVIAGGAYRPRAVASPQIAPLAAPARPGGLFYRVQLASAPGTARVFGIGPQGYLLGPDFIAGIFGAARFIEPFFFGPPFVGNFGIAGSVSQLGGMPLGFGLWPACDSATTPGVFWTVGPCFGLGSYSAELTPAPAQPGPYIPPLFLFSPPPSGQAATQQPPSAPSPPSTLTLYLADGKTIEAKDWWVAEGRLQYITDSGQTGAVDVLQLDLERTIKENQKRGLEFRLKFTAPSGDYPPSIRP
jgi:hypothetical protein